MGRDAGWLTGSAVFGGAEMSLIPEIPMTEERQKKFYEKIKEKYYNSKTKSLIIAVSEGVRWFDKKTGKLDVVYASSEVDEYGHPRFGGISGVIASEITANLKLDARAQITGYYARAGECRRYDKRLVEALADKVADILLREKYGRMPVLSKIVHFQDLYEYNTKTIDMGNVGNFPLPLDYYDEENFHFNNKYIDFLSHIINKPNITKFEHNFPKVSPL